MISGHILFLCFLLLRVCEIFLCVLVLLLASIAGFWISKYLKMLWEEIRNRRDRH